MSGRGTPKRSERESTPTVLRSAIVRKLGDRISATGDVSFPCVPALLDTYMARLVALWDLIGKPFSDDELANLRRAVGNVLEEGFRRAPQARLHVGYQTKEPPGPRVVWNVRLEVETMEQVYARWIASRPPPLFGKHPDAKVMSLAAELGSAAETPVVDVGAGTGRNAIPLALKGHPVTAVEPVPVLAAELRKASKEASAHVDVVEADILSSAFELPREKFLLAVLAEVVPHLRSQEALSELMRRMSGVLAPGGFLVVNSFVAMEGYRPDPVALQVSEVAWCRIFTRGELARATDDLPFDRVSDESVHSYEKDHLPEDAWPPTGWFETWTRGLDVFALPAGKAPVDLRRFVYRRR